MLFYLTDSLIVDKSTPEFPAIRRTVKYLAMAVFESKHLLRGDYQVLRYMEEEFSGDKELYPLFHQLVSKYSTYTVPDDICRYVEVVYSGYDEISKDGHQIRQIPFSYFNDSKKVQEMTVIAEDLCDCVFLEYVLKWYISQNHLPYNYNFASQGGGGSRIDFAVTNSLNSGNMVTCITDSDQRYEGMKPRAHDNCVTCGKVKAKDKIYYFLVLPVLEVENLVPLNHYEALSWKYEINRKDREAFKKLCGNQFSEQILPYFDIKEGLKKGHIAQYGKGFSDYAEMCCTCNPNIMEGKDFDEYIDELEDKDLIYPRLRKRPMAELAPMYKNGNVDEPELMSFQFNAWMEVGALLLDTTCARNKEAITG